MIDKNKKYVVDIKGEVYNPGIYKLKANSRVVDVIEMAGGLTENANTTVINLSKKITDEMVIIIYSNKEVKDFKKTKELEASLIERCKQKDANSLENDACIEGDKTNKDNNSKVNLNTATKEELMTLTGIGEAKADDIISYRNNTPFNTIEDIKNAVNDAIEKVTPELEKTKGKAREMLEKAKYALEVQYNKIKENYKAKKMANAKNKEHDIYCL